MTPSERMKERWRKIRAGELPKPSRNGDSEHGGCTKLTKPVSRETSKRIGSRPVILTIAPCGAQSEALIGLRLKGKRTQYVCALSDVYRMAALWHGQKEMNARRAARKSGTPWKQAKRAFIAQNTI